MFAWNIFTKYGKLNRDKESAGLRFLKIFFLCHDLIRTDTLVRKEVSAARGHEIARIPKTCVLSPLNSRHGLNPFAGGRSLGVDKWIRRQLIWSLVELVLKPNFSSKRYIRRVLRASQTTQFQKSQQVVLIDFY